MSRGPTRSLTIDEGQRVFKVLLDALAHPGRLVQLPDLGHPLDLPLLALTDPTTPVATLDPIGDEAEHTRAVITHTGAPSAPVDRARFVVGRHDPDPIELAALYRGELDNPHEAALLIQAALVAEYPQPDFVGYDLTGPGTGDGMRVHVSGLTADFFRVRADLVADHPRGVDVLLIDPLGRVLGLARTTVLTPVTD